MTVDQLHSDPISGQIRFILEIDKLKSIRRRTYLINGERRENSAEHSWHITVMAMILAEHANEKIDVLRVMKMLIIHDIVEIDAGDTLVYDTVGRQSKKEREREAADRIFELLPEDQAGEMRELWDEYEARTTPEAKFAAALDRLMPLLHNYHTEGRAWKENNITSEQVYAHNAHIEDGSKILWRFAVSIINDAVLRGYLNKQGQTK